MSQGSPTFGLDDVILGASIVLGSAAIGIDGIIIVGFLHVLFIEAVVHEIVQTGSKNGGYDASPWPTARGKRRANNGRAGG